MKHTYLATIGGAAMLVAALAGCSSNSSEPESTTPETSGSAPESSVEAAAGDTSVTIDGQPQNIEGTVTCATMGGNVNVAIGDSGAGGLALVLSEGDSPKVQSVALGTLGGTALTYQEGMGKGNASATKDGQTYHVTGEAFSADIDITNPSASMGTKPFDITFTCP